MKIHSPLIIGAIMHEALITQVAAGVNGGNPDGGWTNGPMANFSMPEMLVTKGDNPVNFTTTIHFNTSVDADDSKRAFYWVLDTAGGDYAQPLVITAEPTLTALGFIKIKTKLRKELVCNCPDDGNLWCNPQKKVEEPSNL